ncbi:helix-turn-helix transcriptional regulator [Polymorphospora sp. NPDC051019]|uniref:helix-turn-helix domain-containing protein n=1 Tax=Polymorphospora sp. NPDC051019 TaxID=3155725 RepID=UPI003448A3BC
MPFKEPVQRTLRAQWLGHQMRELRRQRGMTLKSTADYLGRDHSALARYERAEWPFKHHDVAALLDIYGVFDGRTRARLLRLCRDTWRTNQWDVDFTDVLPERAYVNHTWLTGHAAVICAYHTHLVPDLLQTPAYAERTLRLREPATPAADRAARLDDRIASQRAFEAGGNNLSVVLDDAVLHRDLGDPELMRAQLDHLVALAARPRIEIRVLPAGAHATPRFDGSFQVFRMPEPYPEVAYVENLAGQIYVEAPQSKRFVLAFDHLRDAALTAAESTQLITAAVLHQRA